MALYISWCPVSISTGSAARVMPAAIRIHSLISFDLELQLINASLVQLPVLFSGRGEQWLERKKRPGHNLRQYGKLMTLTCNILLIFCSPWHTTTVHNEYFYHAVGYVLSQVANKSQNFLISVFISFPFSFCLL